MRKVLKWFGIAVGSLVGLLVISGLAIFAKSDDRMNEAYEIKTTFPTEQVVPGTLGGDHQDNG